MPFFSSNIKEKWSEVAKLSHSYIDFVKRYNLQVPDNQQPPREMVPIFEDLDSWQSFRPDFTVYGALILPKLRVASHDMEFPEE